MHLKLTLIVALLLPLTVHAEERVQHYAAQKPASVKQAVETLTQRTKIVEQALQKNELEAIHEQSYMLEAAGDMLQAHAQKQQKALDTVNEAIQGIHALSEKGDAAGVRMALPRLKKGTEELQAL